MITLMSSRFIRSSAPSSRSKSRLSRRTWASLASLLSGGHGTEAGNTLDAAIAVADGQVYLASQRRVVRGSQPFQVASRLRSTSRRGPPCGATIDRVPPLGSAFARSSYKTKVFEFCRSSMYVHRRLGCDTAAVAASLLDDFPPVTDPAGVVPADP